jgi:hypothetical protein
LLRRWALPRREPSRNVEGIRMLTRLAIRNIVLIEALDLGDEERPGRVRWAHDGFVGIKFAAALRSAELNQWLETSRMAPELCYGT